MTGHISNHAATVAEVLRDEGYTTFAVGKWHLCQMADASAAGPFDQWPLQRGFDRFYGFLEGETDQYSPDLTYDNHRVDAPATRGGRLPPERGPRRPRDRVHPRREVRAARPSVLLLPRVRRDARAAPGAAGVHGEVPRPVRRRLGRRARAVVRAAASSSASCPKARSSRRATRASSRGTSSPRTSARSRRACRRRSPRSSTTPTSRSAGSSTTSREIGELDNTLVFVLADNGASQEGGPFGVLHEMKFFNGILETPDEAIAADRRDRRPAQPLELPVGLGAGRQHAVQVVQAEHPRGRRPRAARSCTGRTGSPTRGELRNQFHHVNDIVPSIYDVLGVDAAGRLPRPRPDAGDRARRCGTRSTTPDAPSRKTVQYFEMAGHRGIYADGWKAVTAPHRGRAVRRRRVGAVPRRRGLLRVPRPRGRACRTSSPSSSSCGGPRPRRTASCRSTTGSSSCSARASRTTPRTRRTGATSTGRRCRRCPRRPRAALGGRGWDMTATIDRSATDEGVHLRERHRERGLQLLRPGLAAGVRLQRVRRPPGRWSRTARCRSARRRSGCRSGAPARATARSSCSSTTSPAGARSSRCS